MNSRRLFYVFGVVALVAFFGVAAHAWVGPTLPPADGNATPPINAGSTGQIKSAGLTLGSGFAPGSQCLKRNSSGGCTLTGYPFSLYVQEGLTSFGTALAPGSVAGDELYRVTVNGNIRAIDQSNTGKGKVYANELCLPSGCRADWSTLTAGGGSSGSTDYLAKWASGTTLGASLFARDDGVMMSLTDTSAASAKPLFFVNRSALAVDTSTFGAEQKKAALYVRAQNGYPLQVDAGNGTALSVDALGRTGLGIATPDSVLHVAKSAANAEALLGHFQNTGGGGTAVATVKIGEGTPESQYGVLGHYGADNSFRIGNMGPTGNNGYLSLHVGTIDKGTTLDSSSEKVRITKGGAVGIGTQAPDETLGNKLDVAGTVKATGFCLPGSAANDCRSSWATITGSNYWALAANGTDISRDSGNVGIGTVAPIKKLHVGGATDVIRVGPNYLTGGDRDYVDLVAHPTDTRVSSANERFHIENTSGPLILQEGSGKVGIGTASPSAKLGIQGLGENLIDIRNTGATNAGANQGWRFAIGGPGNYEGYLKVLQEGATSNDWTMALIPGTNGNALTKGANFAGFVSSPSFNSPITGRGESQIMQWTNTGGNFNGKLTVGQDYPNGTSGVDVVIGPSNGALNVRNNNNASYLYVNSSDGKVGIGMTGPESRLSVNSGGTNGFTSGTLPPGMTIYGTPSDGYGAALTFKPDTGAQGTAGIGSFRTSGYSTDLRFYTNNTVGTNAFSERMRIDPAGNVGIGTTQPGAKLAVVSGNTATTSILTDGYVEDVSGRRNLIPSHVWNVGTGPVGVFTANGAPSEQVREWGVGPHGQQAIVWKAVPDGDHNADGGWNTTTFPIDHTKTYRVSTWIKRAEAQSGSVYFGILGSDVTYLGGGVETNPYFYCGDLPALNKWYLLVGYIHGSGDSSTTSYGGMYDGETGVKLRAFNGGGQCTTDYKFTTTATMQQQRSYLYYNQDASTRQYWWDPRFEEVNGTEPTLASLIGINPSIAAGGWFDGGASVYTQTPADNVGIGTTDTGGYKLSVNGPIKALGSSIFAQSDNGTKNYTAAPIQLREAQYGATGSFLPPRLSFHWGGIVASQLGIESDGTIAVLDNPGTGYEKFKAGAIRATGALTVDGAAQANGGLTVKGALNYGITYDNTTYSRTEARNNAGLQGNAGAQSGFFEASSPVPAANWYPGANSWQHLIDTRHSNNGNNYALQIAGSFFDQDLYFRKTNNNPATAWSKVIATNGGITNIAGTINLAGNVNITNGGILNVSSGGIRFPDGTSLASAGSAGQWTTSGANIYNSNSGNVGIGTSTPDASVKLHVVAGDKSLALFGPNNATWAGELAVGASPTQLTAKRAQVISTDGNLHLDSAIGHATYINYYSQTPTFINPQGGNVGIGSTGTGYKLTVAGDIYANGGWLRTSGNAGWYSETYGGGWWMTDTSWIRTYNSKSVWTDVGLLGSNGGLTVGYGGVAPSSGGAIIAGSVGIGTTNPLFKLQTSGAGSFGDGPFVLAGGVPSSDFYDSQPGIYRHTPGLMARKDSIDTTLAGTPVGMAVYNNSGTLNSWTKLSLANRETPAAGANPISVAGIAAQLTAGAAGGWGSGDLVLWTKSGPIENEVLRATSGGNVGIGNTLPRAKLDVQGAANIWAGARAAVPANYMAGGSLTVGNTNANFGGGWNWNANTSGILLETLDNTEIAVHDSGNRLASMMYYEGGAVNKLSIGRDMSWGNIDTVDLLATNVKITGNLGVGIASPTAKLQVLAGTTAIGTGSTVYTGGGKTPAWGSNWNLHSNIQGAGNSPYGGYPGGSAGAIINGGVGSYYAGGGAGVVAIGGNSGEYSQGGAGIYARGGTTGNSAKSQGVPDAPAGYFEGNLVASGNMGIGTGAGIPGAKLSFANLNDGRNSADGITWYSPSPFDYGIYRTAGAWTGNDYQQLKLSWVTGIVLNPGSNYTYGKNYVDVQGNMRITGTGYGLTFPDGTKQTTAGGASSWRTKYTTGSGVPYIASNDSSYVTIGTVSSPTAYNLNVGGQINSTSGFCINGDCKPSWASVGQWANIVGGISYTGGSVGIGGAPAAGMKLDVQGGPIKATGGLVIETRTDSAGSGMCSSAPSTAGLDSGRMWLCL